MTPRTTFKLAETRVARLARKGLLNHFLTVLVLVGTPVWRCCAQCTLVASKIDYSAFGLDVFSPPVARHASLHYRYITIIYEQAQRGRKCNRIKNEGPFCDGKEKHARRKSRELLSACWSDNIRIYLFSPRNLYTECLTVSGYNGS